MDRIKYFLPRLLIITSIIIYVYDKPLAERLFIAAWRAVLIGFSIGVVHLGGIIIRNNKRLAEDRMERFNKDSFQRALRLHYRESPLRLTIMLAGVSIIGFGFLFLAVTSSSDTKAAFDGFRGIVFISAIITVISSGFVAIITALFMLKRR